MPERPRATPDQPYHNPASGWTFYHIDGVRERAEKTPPEKEAKDGE